MSRSSLPVHPQTGLTALWVSPSGRAFYPIAGADGRTPGNPVLTRLLDQRSEQETFIDQLLQRVEAENRDLVEAERNNLTAARERIAELDAQIEPLEEFEATRSAHRAAAPPAPRQQGSGESRAQGSGLAIQPREVQYRSAGDFIVDQIRAVGYPGAQIAPDADAAQRIAAALGRAAEPHNTTDETPGLLPTPIVGSILTDLDGSRPFVQSVGAKPLAGIPGKTFTRPRVTQHTEVGKQAAEKTELATRQFKVDGIPFTKETFGGWLNVSRQEIDWTSPSAWNALIADLQMEYGADTDDFAAAEFAADVTQTVQFDDESTDRIGELIKAMYAAARVAATANGTKRATALRLPNHLWVSIDQWELLGAAIDRVRALVQGSSNPGNTSVTSFAGSILDLPRTMVPGLPAGSLIIGRTQLFEYYEERIGLLQAIEPKVLGVEVSYGGYAAAGFLDPTAFTKIVPDAA